MKQYLLTLIFSLQMMGGFTQPLPIQVKAKYAILMNAQTGRILYGKNIYEKIYPASTTKMATLLFFFHALESVNLDQIITVNPKDLVRVSEDYKVSHEFEVPAFWLEYDGRHFGFKPGERVSLSTLLHALMLYSSNDAANILAAFLCSDMHHFIFRFNAFLQSIGCIDTHFLNPHGLYHPKHYTTAYDLALITKLAMENEAISKIISTKEFVCPSTNKNKEKRIQHSNALLSEGPFYYPMAIGGKTGYTKDAGYNLVAVASDGDRELIAVVNKLSAKEQMYRDVITMFETAFNEEKIPRLLFNQKESMVYINLSGGKKKLKAQLQEDIYIEYYPSEQPTIHTKQSWYDIPFPIRKGTKVGELQIYDQEDHLLSTHYYFAANHVDARFLTTVITFFSRSGIRYVIFCLLIGGGVLFRKRKAAWTLFRRMKRVK